MKRSVFSVLVIGILCANAPVFGQQKKLLRPDVRGAQAGRPAAPMIQLIQGMYLNQLQQQTEITDDQYLKVVPFLRQYLAAQYELGGPRRNRAQTELQRAIRSGASDDELARLVQQLDEVDRQTQATQQSFFENVDPLLSVRQRARLRIFLVMMDRRIRNLIQEAQTPTPRGNQAPPADKKPS